MYLNIFRHRKKPGIDIEAYLSDATRMEEPARKQPGFLTYRRYTHQDGEALSISEWESEAHARDWSRHAEHLAVQSRARAEYYENYVIYSCTDAERGSFGGDAIRPANSHVEWTR